MADDISGDMITFWDWSPMFYQDASQLGVTPGRLSGQRLPLQALYGIGSGWRSKSEGIQSKKGAQGQSAHSRPENSSKTVYDDGRGQNLGLSRRHLLR